jgi:hypothetical protein
MQDAKLYELLALFDALRVGKARERGMALERLQALIDPDSPKKTMALAWLTPTWSCCWAWRRPWARCAIRWCLWAAAPPACWLDDAGLDGCAPHRGCGRHRGGRVAGAYHRLAEQLMQRGFTQTMEDNTPPFRWFWHRMQLDLVPLDEKVP